MAFDKINPQSSPSKMRGDTLKKNGNNIVHVLTEEGESKVDDLAMAEAFKPVLYCNMVFGLLWKKPDNYGKKCKFDQYTIHTCILLIIVWLQAIKYCASYESTDTYGLLPIQF